MTESHDILILLNISKYVASQSDVKAFSKTTTFNNEHMSGI